MYRIFLVLLIPFSFLSCQSASHRNPASTVIGKTKEYRRTLDNLESARRIGLKKYLESSEGAQANAILMDITELSDKLYDLTNDWYNGLSNEDKNALKKALIEENRND